MLTAYIDGGSAPENPGGTGGYGVVVKDKEEIIYTEYGSEPPSNKVSNNLMEYRALLNLLTWFTNNSNDQLLILSDSKMLVKQMTGKFAIRSGLYYDEAIKARNIVMDGLKPRLEFRWIPRDKNIADELSTKAITEYNDGLHPG